MEVRDILFDRSLAELCIEFGMHSTYKINAHILFFECNAQIRVTHALVLRVWREMNILNHPVLDPFQFRVSRALLGNSRFLRTSWATYAGIYPNKCFGLWLSFPFMPLSCSYSRMLSSSLFFASSRGYLKSVRKLNESFNTNISQERPNNWWKSSNDHKALYSWDICKLLNLSQDRLTFLNLSQDCLIFHSLHFVIGPSMFK